MPSISRNPGDMPQLETWLAATYGDEAACMSILALARRIASAHFGGCLAGLPRDEVEELHQEIVKSVLLAMNGGVAPRTNLLGFLHWRVRACLKEFFGQRARARAVQDDGELSSVACLDSGPGESIASRERHSILLACIRSIENEDHRRAWLDRFVHERTPQQTAANRKVPNSRVRTWIKRGADSMRSRFGGTLAALAEA